MITDLQPVPVELTSFTAEAAAEGVLLKWTTASELNNHGFEVERSLNSIEFYTVAFIPGSGTTTETKTYAFEPEFAVCVNSVHRALTGVFGEHDRDAWKAEEAHTSPLGFGGRVDLWSPTLRGVADIKSKDFSDPSGADAPQMYPEQARQLAAYASMVLPFEHTPVVCVNVLVSRQNPQLVVIHRWSYDQIAKAWKEFQLLWELWKLTKGYEP